MINYKRFHKKAWLVFGKTLMLAKGSEQAYFLESCRSGKKEFIDYMEEHLLSNSNYPNSVIGSTTHTLAFDRPGFSEQEFINLEQCPENEQVIWETFESAGDAVFDCGFWGYVTLDMIKENYIQPLFLAGSGDGAKTIDNALQDDSNTQIDVVKRILRAMCNPAPRGKRVIFNDCYLSKSYWRWHWADKMSSHIQLNPKEIRKTLDATSYGTFSERMHSGRSYIGSENVFGGLLLYLRDNQGKKNSKLRKIINHISYLSSWKAIEMQDVKTNQKEIQQIADSLPDTKK